MSSDSENEEVSYMAKHPIDYEEVSAKIDGLQYFCCNRQRIVANGQKKDCKGRGFARNLDRHFYVTKDHFHSSKQLEFEKKQCLARGMKVAEASPTTKTKSALRVIKRGAGRDLLAVFPKDNSIKRQIQRKKYKINMSTIDSKKPKMMIIPAGVQLTHDSRPFLRYDSRISEPGSIVYFKFCNNSKFWISHGSSFGCLNTGMTCLGEHEWSDLMLSTQKAPRGFYQIFTVHAFIDGRFLVVGFAWMAKKDGQTYDRVFRELFCYPQISYSLQAFVSDFEAAPSYAIKSIFPDASPIKCIFHLSQSIQKWARKHGLANFYANGELKEWIILFSKLAYLPAEDVFMGFAALIKEYEGLLMLQIAKESDEEIVSAFLDYVRKNYIYQGSLSNPKAARFPLNEWNINKHIFLQRPVSNNAVESWNRQYKGHFSGGGKPDRSKVIQHHVDEEESVRHAVIRHEERPEEEFRQVRPRQLESEEQVHGLVSAWNERRRLETEEPFYEDVINFLKSIQDALFFANGQNPDVDEWSDDEEQEEEE